MNLIQQIKNDQIQARKSKETLKVKLLTTLLSEAAIPGINDGKRDSTDTEVIAVVKKFIKNAQETLSHCHNDDIAVEISLLEKYLPKQLTDEQIRVIISTNDTVTNVGQAMKFLKDNYNGQYDGRVASTVAKQMFS